MAGTALFILTSLITGTVSVGCFSIFDAIPVSRTAVLLRIGPLDSPIPDDLNPLGVDMSNDDDDDQFIEFPVLAERLFSIQTDGKESRGLLPPLQRRLDSGVECYFEPNDQLVKNLIDKTLCNPSDACWALEACNGDITEAWTRISFARRMMLNELRDKQRMQEDPDYNTDEYEQQVVNAYEIQKGRVKAQINKRNRDDYFTPAKPETPWTPIKNPNPIADEPWFTG